MIDKELADKVIALGIGKRPGSGLDDFVYFKGMGREDHFVRDWRVAGALMERWADDEYHELEVGIDEKGLHYCACTYCPNDWTTAAWVADESLPRAIIGAYVKALESNDRGRTEK